MGYIKEPKGVDLVIGPSVLTEQDRKMISGIIADYKRTGKLPGKQSRQKRNVRLHGRTDSQLQRKKVLA